MKKSPGRFFLCDSFFPLQEALLNFPVKEKSLRAGSHCAHCGGGKLCRWSDLLQAENPAKQDSVLLLDYPSFAGRDEETVVWCFCRNCRGVIWYRFLKVRIR